MNLYEIKGSNNFNGNSGTWTREAISEQEARDSFGSDVDIESIKMVGESAPIIAEKKEEDAIEIIDAEEILYEMDANNCDKITVKEGFWQMKPYTRKEVEKSLFGYKYRIRAIND